MNIKIEIDENELKKIILRHITGIVQASVDVNDIKIEVKSKQNFKSEWETATFRAVYHKAF